jgi:hypothetical protein
MSTRPRDDIEERKKTIEVQLRDLEAVASRTGDMDHHDSSSFRHALQQEQARLHAQLDLIEWVLGEDA